LLEEPRNEIKYFYTGGVIHRRASLHGHKTNPSVLDSKKHKQSVYLGVTHNLFHILVIFPISFVYGLHC